MKRKISLICAAILFFIVTISGVILITDAANSIISATQDQALSKQQNVQNSFSQMVNYYLGDDDSSAVQYSLVRYCFTRFADDTCVLMTENETIYSQVDIDPSQYVTESSDPTDTYEQMSFSGRMGERDMFIAGGKVGVGERTYYVYVVADVTHVHENISMMTLRFALIGVAFILLGIVLIFLLVHRTTRPLTWLSTSARHIAQGNYSDRISSSGNDEVAVLAQDFNAMAHAIESQIDELTEKNERQRLFIGGVTHEFKTPLTSIILNTDSLQNTYLSEDEREASLHYIKSQCLWLEKLTQNLLKLITLNGEIAKNETNIADMFEQVKTSVHGILQNRNTPLKTMCEAETLYINEDLIKSAIINLIDNASKASSVGQTVNLCAYNNIIEVSDSGHGIAQSEISRITEPFYMVDKSRSKRLGGSGLGLALASEIMSAHGGRILINSNLGQGTRVKLVFEHSDM